MSNAGPEQVVTFRYRHIQAVICINADYSKKSCVLLKYE